MHNLESLAAYLAFYSQQRTNKCEENLHTFLEAYAKSRTSQVCRIRELRYPDMGPYRYFSRRGSFLKNLLAMTRYYLQGRIILQVEYIWKGRKSTCKCGLHCIIVRCLTDRVLIYTVIYLFLFVRSCKISILPRPTHAYTIPLFPPSRIAILPLWGSLSTSTVCRGYSPALFFQNE
jgi:hypothetical protein